MLTLRRYLNTGVSLSVATLLYVASALSVTAAPLPGGTLDPLTVPKYVTPLVIPPEMPKSTVQPTDPANPTAVQPPADYNIAVRQFKQQILPAGLPATTVWSYGRAEEAVPAVAPSPGSSFNYPAFTVEATSGVTTRVRWINDLKDAAGNFLPHLFAVDQTLHWANPPGGTAGRDMPGTDPTPYTGPVPLVTHVHGAHVNPQSDGYPEAWYLPAANNIPQTPIPYATQGSNYGQFDLTNTVPGSAFFGYENTQSATTLWYHDHALGMTRLNVYAGPAGFWLVRGGANGDANAKDGVTGVAAKLPGPAPAGAGDPNFDPAYRATIREIPLAIQDRSFNADGSLFYPDSRAFFDTFAGPYAPTSDIAPIWNPEAFFNTMVVNGSTWPKLEVAPAKYRFRLLNGCNSRFLNLVLQRIQVKKGKLSGQEMSFYQIGAEQGFLPKVVEIRTGFATPLPGNGTMPMRVQGPNKQQALLMGPAERADVIVDFSGLANGTIVQLINTAPDAPFGGFPDIPADPGTTGQVMQFVVNTALLQPTDAATTSPLNLVLPADAPIGPASVPPRSLSLNEMESSQVCVSIDPAGNITTLFTSPPNDPNFLAACAAAGGVPQAPKAALLGTFDPATATSTPLMFHEPITENPALGSTEEWEINNLTVDAHPIHVHLVKFQVINRQLLDPLTLLPVGVPTPALPAEAGYKDTVIAYPGQVTRIRATFDIAGLYVWHCHIVEHEDNEMMRPFTVVGP
jgi:FtsP/CotA-like multicopper oxidase with cupredoxin domain